MHSQLNFLEGKIHFYQLSKFKNQPTLIFLHDSLGCVELWRDFPMILAELTKCNLLIYDRFGYGKSSDFITKERSNDYMEIEADLLIKIVEKLDIHSPILFGHSDGGTIALLAAAKYPNKIEGIITEGAHIFVEEITKEGIQAAVKTYKTTDLKLRLEKYHGNKTDALFQAWTKTWLSESYSGWNIEHFLHKITCPVFVIQGELDEFGSLLQVEKIIKGILHEKKSSFIPLNARHTPHKEAKTETLQECEKFINQLVKNIVKHS